MHVDMCQPLCVAWLVPMAGWLVAAIFLLFCSAVWVGIHKCSKNRPSVRAVKESEKEESCHLKCSTIGAVPQMGVEMSWEVCR